MNFRNFIERYNIKIVIALSVIVVTWVNFNQERWLSKDVIDNDVVSYNSYLPAFFYEHDLSLSFLKDTLNSVTESRYYTPRYTPEGKPVIKMSMGMAVTYLPFFALAHVYCKIFNYPADGFSEPYHFALQFSSLVYHVIGLLFLWKILRRYFSVRICMLVLFCITFSTNAFYYLTMSAAYSHTANFAFLSIFLYYTIRWHENPGIKYAIAVGLTGGLLTLIRPINFLAFTIFFLYGIRSFSGLIQKPRFFFRQKLSLLLLVMSAFAVVLPQLLYWKFITGHYFFNSYVGERFYFGHPHVLAALLGFRKGWLIYTPVMIFALIGFTQLKRDLKPFSFSLVIFLGAYIYIAFSWWCWWYGGSFGQRVLIDIYPILAIPFAAFFRWAGSFNRYSKISIYVLTAFFTALNLFQSMQAKYNIIHYDSMTAKAYFHVFGTTSKSEDREKYLVHPDYDRAQRGENEQ